MTNAKHTPGPWSAPEGYGLANGVPYVGVDSPDGTIAWVIARTRRPHAGHEHDTPCEANARLIAAAPELLMALEYLVNACPEPALVSGGFDSPPEHASPEDHELGQALFEARAAIAKARGETELAA